MDDTQKKIRTPVTNLSEILFKWRSIGRKFFKRTINNIAAASVQWPFIFSVKPRAIIGLVSIEPGVYGITVINGAR